MPADTFHILTFGCQMNVNDSLWMARSLRRLGFVETALESARVVILNTCSVREKPEQKVYSALGHLRRATRETPGAFAVVTGCVAQHIGKGFFDRFPHVRLVAGGDGIVMVPQAILRLCADPDLRLDYTLFSASYPERDPALSARAGEQPGPVAYVSIMQGCDNFCAYCIVPYTRGRQKSRATDAILDECRAALDSGAQEITLLGQNVNAFGLDAQSEPGVSFPSLLRRVAALPGLARLRFVTPHPKDFSPETIALFSELPALCPRLHLPMQAGSDAVLARMRRRYHRADYLQLVKNLRRARPDLALSTDIIVGFPGESEADFQETLDMLDAAAFMSSFSFAYSDRPGTAASRFPDKIPPQIKAERLERLQARQEILSGRWLADLVGRETRILLEGPSRKAAPLPAVVTEAERPASSSLAAAPDGSESWQGRDPWGDVVNVRLPKGAGAPGVLLPVRLTAAKRHSLLAEALDQGKRA